MRLVVIGRHGQVARALTEAGSLLGVEVVPIGRPELDLTMPETVHPALAHAEPDIVTNAAAYTAVDQAEREPNEANTVNATGAGTVAAAACALGVPIIQLSTAAAIFDFVAANGRRKAVVTPIPSAEYPTAAHRPKNSRLDCSKLARHHGVQLPP